MAQLYSGGIIIATGFKTDAPQLIDDRCAVELDSDLDNIPNLCKGLHAYSDENGGSLHYYNGTNWIKIATGGDLSEMDLQAVLENGNTTTLPIWFPYNHNNLGHRFSVYPDPINNPNLSKMGQFTVKAENDGYLSIYTALHGNDNQLSTNVYYGYQPLFSLKKEYINNLPEYNGRNNTAFGWQPLKYLTKGYGNAAFGFAALRQLIEGADNTALGEAPAEGATYVDESVIVGATAAANSSYLQNAIIIGRGAAQETDTIINSTLIGNFQHGVELSENEIIIADGRITGGTDLSGVGFQVTKEGRTTLNRQTQDEYDLDSTGKAAVTKEILNNEVDSIDLQSVTDIDGTTTNSIILDESHLFFKPMSEYEHYDSGTHAGFWYGEFEETIGLETYNTFGWNFRKAGGNETNHTFDFDDTQHQAYFFPQAPTEAGNTPIIAYQEWVDKEISNYIPLAGTEADKPITGLLENVVIDTVAYPAISSNYLIKDENDFELLNIGTGWTEGNEMGIGGVIKMNTAPNDDSREGQLTITPFFLRYEETNNGTGTNLTSSYFEIGDSINDSYIQISAGNIVGNKEFDKDGDRTAFAQIADVEDYVDGEISNLSSVYLAKPEIDTGKQYSLIKSGSDWSWAEVITLASGDISLTVPRKIDTNGNPFTIEELPDKRMDATFNKFLGMNSNGQFANIGFEAFRSEAESWNDEQRKEYAQKLNGNFSNVGVSVNLISPPVFEQEDNDVYVVLRGANLNLHPTNRKIEILDASDNTVLAEVPNGQVQTYADGLQLIFYYNFNTLGVGTYKLKITNGVATYITTHNFQIVGTVTNIDLTGNTFDILTSYTNTKSSANDSTVIYESETTATTAIPVFSAKSDEIFEQGDDWVLEVQLEVSINGGSSEQTRIGVGYSDVPNQLVFSQLHYVGFNRVFVSPTTYVRKVVMGGVSMNIGTPHSTTVVFIKQGNIVTAVSGTSVATQTISNNSGYSLFVQAAGRAGAHSVSAQIIKAYKFN